MKKILILLAATTLIGCSNFSPRKDLSSNIVIKNLKEGEHKFTLISIDYPKSYKAKVRFYKELNVALNKINDAQKTAINLVINKEMSNDLISLLENGWIDKEILAMKNASDLTGEELAYLNSINIAVPQDGGETQKILNKQYYLLLTLLDSKDMYNSNYLYTELDKSSLMESTLLERNEVIANLNKIKKNFVYTEDLKGKPAYLGAVKKTTLSPVIFVPSKEYYGFRVLKDNILIYVGKNGKKIETSKFDLESNIVRLTTPLNLDNSTLIMDSEGVSKLLNWERVKSKGRMTKIPSIEDKFLNWEATN